MKKRILSLLLTLVLLLGAIPITTAETEAAVTYNVSKALDYAKAHWNDGIGWCAEFVSKCVIAGGLKMDVYKGTGDCLRGAEKASGLKRQQLTLDSSGHATKSLNSNILAAGDLVIQECVNCKTYPNQKIKPHVLLCAGFNNKGQAVYYAHNGAMNKGTYVLNRNSGKDHVNCRGLIAYVVHLSSLDTTTQKDSVTFSNFSVKPSRESASIEYKISYTGTKPSAEGLIYGPSPTEMVHKYEYAIGTNANPYSVNYGCSNLDSNRTYYYQPYVIVNGKTINGSTNTFKTTKYTTALTIKSEAACGYKLTVNPNYEVYLYSAATATEATGYLNPSSTAYSLFATKKVTLSNGTARYYCIDSNGDTAWVGYLNQNGGMKLPETVHNYSKKVIAPTYTTQGYTLYTCACGYNYKDNYTPVLTKPTPTPVPKPTPAPSAFTDVPKDAYYYTPVTWAVKNNITTGTSSTSFSPEDICTRAQVVTFLWRAAGSPKVSAVNPFTDAKKSDYYYDAVLWAVKMGITTGTSATKFSPNQNCTRGQVVTFLYRAKGSPYVGGYKHNFNDINYLDYYYDAVIWAVKNNITTGTSATAFSPNSSCTRGQIVTFLYRAEN